MGALGGPELDGAWVDVGADEALPCASLRAGGSGAECVGSNLVGAALGDGASTMAGGLGILLLAARHVSTRVTATSDARFNLANVVGLGMM